MNFQQSRGDYSPNINGDNNQTNQDSNNTKISLACKARYTLLGFLIGVAASYVGSCLYDNYKIEKVAEKNLMEQPVTIQSTPVDSIE